MRLKLQLVLLLAAALNGGAAVAADWPQWLGPTRNGVSPEIIAPWEGMPKIAWRLPVGNGYSAPIAAEGIVFAHMAVAGQEAEKVQALDAQTGQEIWTDTYARGRYRSQLGVGPRTTPTVVEGKLYTFGITGVLSCYDARAGKRLWQVNPYESNKVALPRFGVCSSPVVAEGRVVVLVGGGGSAVVAYDSQTGKPVWKGLDEPASSAAPIVLIRGEGDKRIADVVVQTTLRTVGLSPQDGSMRWEHPLVFQPSGVSPTPLAIGKSFICTTQDTGTLALEFDSGETVKPRSAWWKQDLTSYFSTGTAGPEGSVLIITNVLMPLPRTDVRCLDLAKGTELWRKEGLGYYHVGLISTGDEKLLILDDGGHLILAEVNREGYKELVKSQVCRGTLSSPALAEGRVFVRDDKEIICVDLNAPASQNEKTPEK